jgi:hypothetical protein
MQVDMTATPDLAAVRAVIESPQPLSALTPHFASRRAALEYYADFMGEKWLSASADQCACCGKQAPMREETYVWQANVHTGKTILASFGASAVTLLARTFTTYHHEVGFATNHRFCKGCGRMAMVRRLFAVVVYHLLFALLILCLLASVCLTVMFGTVIFAAHDLVLKMGLLWLASLIPLALSVAGFEWCRRLRIPKALRAIGRFPFFVREVNVH